MNAVAAATAISAVHGDSVLPTARAEALHVDGYFSEAAEAWETLSELGHCGWEAPVKAAASMVSAGKHEQSEAFLRMAEQMDAPGEVTRYIRAQRALVQSRNIDAFAILEASRRDESRTRCVSAIVSRIAPDSL